MGYGLGAFLLVVGLIVAGSREHAEHALEEREVAVGGEGDHLLDAVLAGQDLAFADGSAHDEGTTQAQCRAEDLL